MNPALRSGASPLTTTSPAHQAYQLLHFGFTAAPIIAGFDKYFDKLSNWDKYLTPIIPRITHMPAHTIMLIVGVIEIIAGIIVAFRPRMGANIVGCWLIGIVINLFLVPGYFDVALRDFGLALGAFALARLSTEFDTPQPRRITS